MQITRLAIASGVVGVTCALFLAAYIANGIGQFDKTGTYIIPDSLVDLLKIVLAGSVTVLTIGSSAAARQSIEKKQDDAKPITKQD